MLGLAIFALAIWLGGAAMGVPTRMRLVVLILLYVAVLLGLVLQPVALGARLGGSAIEWLVVGALGLAIWGYLRGLAWVRTKARRSEETAAPDMAKGRNFTPTELDRYARHIVLHDIGGTGQSALKKARVLVIGAGGLGAPALQYLAAAGVGTIGIVDDDIVDNSNLQRQVIHKDNAIGKPKVFSAQAELEAQNPFVTIRPYHRRFTADVAADLVKDYDIILDGTDNFETRYLANRAAIAAGIPLVSGALSQWEGQVSLFDPTNATPCYECIFPVTPSEGLAPSCAQAGVLGPLPGIIGSMMAAETVKHITGAGQTLAGRMMIYDALYAQSRVITLQRRPDCAVCGPKAQA